MSSSRNTLQMPKNPTGAQKQAFLDTLYQKVQETIAAQEAKEHDAVQVEGNRFHNQATRAINLWQQKLQAASQQADTNAIAEANQQLQIINDSVNTNFAKLEKYNQDSKHDPTPKQIVDGFFADLNKRLSESPKP